ncbi:MAG TPA: hypothetical protein PLO02_06260 [Tenuifilaceae bacterium]|nr:hypothetical protein [Bacteroidales bacterium]MDI9515733.1 hypothetical protein [Bacteroidota bacterium]HNV81396.1 hypothetical protein [Tenuifilaceae bacterium]MZP81753.1 hypothetical protein [Bacteroidales bacterium]HOF91805.1 hypothetical protein [Tenuifilaceae bacterium]
MKICTKCFLSKKMWLLCIIVSILLLPNCTPKNKVLNCNEVQSIKVAYLPKGINPNKAISNCEDIFQYKPVLKDTILTDKELICSFVNLVNKLKISDEPINSDFRIICLIVFNDNRQPVKICFGEGYLTVYNQTLMKDSDILFNMLDEVLYTRSEAKH